MPFDDSKLIYIVVSTNCPLFFHVPMKNVHFLSLHKVCSMISCHNQSAVWYLSLLWTGNYCPFFHVHVFTIGNRREWQKRTWYKNCLLSIRRTSSNRLSRNNIFNMVLGKCFNKIIWKTNNTNVGTFIMIQDLWFMTLYSVFHRFRQAKFAYNLATLV